MGVPNETCQRQITSFNITNNPVKKSEAKLLPNQIEWFDFILEIYIWYDVLFVG